ncbi:hypothetical protein [Rhodoferax sp.]|uniref:hypothetical protein n=1 Tax=Rhodoferax sp. TaxID=50421 RepID=UPI0025DADF5A|nr:hypothetical protein [Rhodoferax sp.]
MSIRTTLCRTLFLTALLCTAAAQAADPAASASAQARYKQDMALCNSGKSNQNVATCKIEAERALAESRRGGLTTEAPSEYQQNALRRCAVFQGDDRKDCEARMRQPEGVEGSAQSGGVLRESVTIVPVPAN